MWLTLLIASLGWIFDVFEGQIFVASMREAMPSFFPPDTPKKVISYYNNLALAGFLLGGALGGVFFGMLSDRIGRTTTMIITILVYSLFTCVTAFAQSPWEMIILRFLVALGVGGEWAVASAMVAEVFPKRARAWSGAIFHGSSIFGTYLAILAGIYVVGNEKLGENGWRWGFAIGAIPALLTLWIRWKLREPELWIKAKANEQLDQTQQTGKLSQIFQGELCLRTFIGVSLAAIGLATFWGVHIYAKNLMMKDKERSILFSAGLNEESPQKEKELLFKDLDNNKKIKSAEMWGMFLATTGGGLGLFLFGPLCEFLGRRLAFGLIHLGGFFISLYLFHFLKEPPAASLNYLLPIFGFFTLGMHAGYAIYFPELYPTRLRGTGAGFCFNVGRILAAPILILSIAMHEEWEYSLEKSVTPLCFLYLLGVLLMFFAPETKGKELPE